MPILTSKQAVLQFPVVFRMRVLVCNLAVLLCICLFPDSVRAERFDVGSYLMVGNAECVSVENRPNVAEGDVLQFYAAITGERVLVGWDYQQGSEYAENFFYVAANTDAHPFSIEMRSQPGKNMLHPIDRKARAVIRQDRAVDEGHSGRLAAAERGVFGGFPFAMFFSSDYRGIHFEDISTLLARGPGRTSSHHPCGELTVLNENGLRTIEFSQQFDDVFTNRSPDLKLRDTQFPPFDSGLQRVMHSCTFDPPLTAESKAPWTADCLTVREGVGEEVTRVRYLVSVEEFTTDPARIDQEISKVLGLVPDGEMVVTSGPVEYVLHNDQIEPKVDVAALEEAVGLEFRRSNWIWRVLFLFGVVLLAVLLVVFLRRKSAQ